MRGRIRPLPVVAALLVVAGLALMVGSLRIEQTRGTETVATEASPAVIPTVAAVAVTGTPKASEPRATHLFERAQSATSALAYSGVKLVSRWESGRASSVVVAVTHVPGRGTTVAPADAAGSPSAAAPVTVGTATVDESAMLTALVRNYRLTEVGRSSMIGRATTTVEADRADGSVAARFWVDDRTGLVLRRELIDGRGRTVESSAFLRFDVDPALATATATATATVAPTWTVLDASGIDELRSQGWPVPTELRGGMDLYQVRRQVGPDGAVVQLSYTDGLVAMSVFLQKGVLDAASMAGYTPVTSGGGQVWVRDGRLFFVWQSRLATVAGESPAAAGAESDGSHDIVVSTTTDSPLAPIGSVLAILAPRPAAADGVGDRVARGVHRVTSWFDPLG